jgi:hypothetical protein
VEAVQTLDPTHEPVRGRDRVAASFLLVLMGLGSLALWIGIPVGCLYAASKMTDTQASHYLIALPLTLIAMIGFGAFLFWLNRLYLRITLPWLLAKTDDDEPPPRLRGPLEPLLVASMVVAVVALFAWFFFDAHNPGPEVF